MNAEMKAIRRLMPLTVRRIQEQNIRTDSGAYRRQTGGALRSHGGSQTRETPRARCQRPSITGKGASHVGNPSRWVVRASVVGLLAVLCFLAGFSILTQRRVAQLSQRADDANRTSAIYADARFWVGQEESLERKYRLEPSRDVLAALPASGAKPRRGSSVACPRSTRHPPTAPSSDACSRSTPRT